MDVREVREILATHAGELVNPGAKRSPRYGRHAQIQGLLDLAEQVQGVLVPVEPKADFRRRLHGDLLLQAQRRQPVQEASPLVQYRKGILIGAAAVGSVASVAGLVIAVVLRHRHRGATRIAT